MAGLTTEQVSGKQFSTEQFNQTSSILPLPSATLSLTGIRVLLVDDDFDMLNLTALILEQTGATVQTANSAATALKQFDAFQPHVLLSDIAMPEQDGYELLQQVRFIRSESQIPAIALTAFANRDRRE